MKHWRYLLPQNRHEWESALLGEVIFTSGIVVGLLAGLTFR